MFKSIADLRRDSNNLNKSPWNILPWNKMPLNLPCQLIKRYIGQMRTKPVRTLIYIVLDFLKMELNKTLKKLFVYRF